MKRILSVILCIAMVLSTMSFTVFATEDSTDIPEGAEVVTIGSPADFDDFAAAVNYDNPTPSGSDGYYQGVKASWNKNLYVKITADIDMSEVTFTTAIGSYGNGGGFSGTLDGCGHKLYNYKVSGNWNYARALFRQAEDITVKNITFDHFISDSKGVADNKTRPAGVVFASVLGTKNVFENVTVTNSVCHGDNGLGILTGYGSGDYYNTYVTEYTFTNCKINNCTIYSETDRAAVLGEFGRDGDVILTISGCTFEDNELIATIDGVTTKSDLPVWYCHSSAYIERDCVFYTYEHFGYAEEGKLEQVEVNYALKAAMSGDTIIVVKDTEVTEAEAEIAFAKSVDINKGKTDSIAPDGYAWDTEGKLVKIIATIGDDNYWDLDEAIKAAGASDGDEIVIVRDTEITAEQAEAAFAKPVNIYRDNAADIDITIPEGYAWDTNNKLVKITPFVVTADKDTVYEGALVEITVTVNGKELVGAEWTLTFEADKFVQVGTEMLCGEWESEGNPTDQKVLATYTFRALAQGTEPVSASFNVNGDAWDYDGAITGKSFSGATPATVEIKK